MRPLAFGGFPRLMLCVTASVLLLTAAILSLRPSSAFAKRDAWIASLERGDRHLTTKGIAHEWRGDVAAQQALLRRDRWLGGALAGVALLALVGFAQTGRPARKTVTA